MPRATLVQLRSFEAVARLGAVGKAAAQLHLAQPTVSMQMRELAASTGLQLFEPAGRGLRLTEEGALLADTVRELAALWQRFEEELSERRGLKRGLLRLAAVTTTEYFLPELLGPFAQAHPGIDIQLAVENRDAVVRRLRDGLAELAVMMLPPPDLPLNRRPLMEKPLGAGGAARSPAGRPPAHCAGQACEGAAPGPGGRVGNPAGHRSIPEQSRSGLAAAHGLGLERGAQACGGRGPGLAVLSRHTLGAEHPALVELRAVGFPIRRQWFVVWHKERRLSLAAQALLAAWP